MNKHLIVSGIAVLLICIGLSGCTDNILNSEMNRFVGSWESRGMTIFTFRYDGTYKSTITEGTYAVEDGKLICTATNYNNRVLSYYYTFSDNDNILSLNGIGRADSVIAKRK